MSYSYLGGFGKGFVSPPPPADGSIPPEAIGVDDGSVASKTAPGDIRSLRVQKNRAKEKLRRMKEPFLNAPKCGKKWAKVIQHGINYQQIRIDLYTAEKDQTRVSVAQEKKERLKQRLQNVACGGAQDNAPLEDDESGPIVSSETQEIQGRLARLRQQIEAKRSAENARIAKVQATHAKQAAYGRDTQQIKPKSAGYSTEAEKIMGGGTGYHAQPKVVAKPLAGFGAATEVVKEVNYTSDELIKQTELVKQIAADVKMGTATKSELEAAIKELRRKAAIVKSEAKELSGYGDTESKWNPLLVLAGIGLVLYLFRSKG